MRSENAVWQLGLGANLGDRLNNLRAAAAMLEEAPAVRVLRRSRVYETSPEGGPPGQGLYLNAALTVRTDLTPEQLLSWCRQVEHRLGRERGVPNAPRTIDIDLLLCEDRILDQPGLRVPHPRLHQRRFVLAPLADICPDAVHPELGRTVRELLAQLPVASGESCDLYASDWDGGAQ